VQLQSLWIKKSKVKRGVKTGLLTLTIQPHDLTNDVVYYNIAVPCESVHSVVVRRRLASALQGVRVYRHQLREKIAGERKTCGKRQKRRPKHNLATITDAILAWASEKIDVVTYTLYLPHRSFKYANVSSQVIQLGLCPRTGISYW